MAGFETFTHRMVPIVARPYITVQRRGLLSVNQAAYDLLGSPEAVELLFDPVRRILGLHPVGTGVEHAYPVRRPGLNSNSRVIAGTAFTQHYGIETDVSRRWPAELDADGVLCIDLRQPGTEVTSNRRETATAAPLYEVIDDEPADGEPYERAANRGDLDVETA